MQDPAQVSSRKRRSTRAVLGGVVMMAMALLLSTWDVLPPAVPTVGAFTGFVLLAYGVHLGWLVFYEREPDGPAS